MAGTLERRVLGRIRRVFGFRHAILLPLASQAKQII